MELTEDDVLEILKLFENSTFDFLQLEHGERKVTVCKASYAAGTAVPAAQHARGVAVSVPTSASAPSAPAKPKPATAVQTPPSFDPDLLPVNAPMVGKFYTAPSPSDPAYVEVGSKVAAGATLGLIEVMKVFASIKTDVAGTVEQILVRNGEFVESGQPMFLIRPAE